VARPQHNSIARESKDDCRFFDRSNRTLHQFSPDCGASNPRKPNNAANVRAAIRRLRTGLKPFVNGWVDSETADIVPANLDARLASREQEITKLRLPSQKQRTLTMLCQQIEILVRQWAGANGETLNDPVMLRYIDSALNFAGIKHPDISKHRDRLAALVFPKDMPPHSQG
jgi:hypothetical protein